MIFTPIQIWHTVDRPQHFQAATQDIRELEIVSEMIFKYHYNRTGLQLHEKTCMTA